MADKVTGSNSKNGVMAFIEKKALPVYLATVLALGGAALAGCDNTSAMTDNNPGTSKPPIAEPANNNENPTTSDDTPEQPATDTPEQSTSNLPADWESWGVSAEVAQARWNYILNEVKKIEERGFAVTKYGIVEDNPNSWFIVQEDPDGDGFIKLTGGFTIAHTPPLY